MLIKDEGTKGILIILSSTSEVHSRRLSSLRFAHVSEKNLSSVGKDSKHHPPGPTFLFKYTGLHQIYDTSAHDVWCYAHRHHLVLLMSFLTALA